MKVLELLDNEGVSFSVFPSTLRAFLNEEIPFRTDEKLEEGMSEKEKESFRAIIEDKLVYADEGVLDYNFVDGVILNVYNKGDWKDV